MYKFAFKVKSFFINENSLYQDKLIKDLHKEHQNLFETYIKITKEENLKTVLKLLKKFYYDYHLHILKEDKQLYKHLLIKYKFDENKFKLIEEKQNEMKDITAFIEDFAKKYSTIENLKNDEFKKELEILGEALTKRVEFEEKELYSLY